MILFPCFKNARLRTMAWILCLGAGMSFAQSPQVTQIVSDGEFFQRLETVHQLPDHLSARDLQKLAAFLVHPSGEPGEAALKNDLINMLRAQSTPPKGLGHTLLSIYRDGQHSPLMRDYAIQHLGAWYPLAQHKHIIRQTLWQACDQTGNSIAGTALLALHRLASKSYPVDREKLAQAALKVARSQGSPLSRLTALRICGELQIREAGEVSRKLLHGSGDLSLKLAAIATLGEVGSEGDASLLEGYLTHPRLSFAAEKALAHLNKRFGEI